MNRLKNLSFSSGMKRFVFRFLISAIALLAIYFAAGAEFTTQFLLSLTTLLAILLISFLIVAMIGGIADALIEHAPLSEEERESRRMKVGFVALSLVIFGFVMYQQIWGFVYWMVASFSYQMPFTPIFAFLAAMLMVTYIPTLTPAFTDGRKQKKKKGLDHKLHYEDDEEVEKPKVHESYREIIHPDELAQGEAEG